MHFLRRLSGLMPVIILISVLSAGPAAQAETRFPMIPPWLDDDRERAATVADEIKKHNARPADNGYVREDVPRAPVMTPRDTLDLLQQMDREKAQPSPLEQSYSRRIVEPLEQFGYDLFGTVTPGSTAPGAVMPSGAVQDDFILHDGDSLTVTFRGQRTDSKTTP